MDLLCLDDLGFFFGFGECVRLLDRLVNDVLDECLDVCLDGGSYFVDDIDTRKLCPNKCSIYQRFGVDML